MLFNKNNNSICYGKKSSLNSKKDLLFYISLMGLPILQFIVFYICVNTKSFAMAFQVYNPLTNETKWEFSTNFIKLYKELKSSTMLLTALKNSAIIFFFKVVCGMSLGLLFSFYIYKKCALYQTFRIALFLPSILSAVVMVSIFQNIADSVIPEIMIKITGKNFIGLLVDPKKQFGSIIFFNIWTYFGVSVLMFTDSMNAISPDVVEAGKLDGAVGLKEFIYITMPSVFKTFVSFLIIALAGFFTDQANLYTFYGREIDNDIITTGYYLYNETQWATRNGYYEEYNYLSAIGLCMTVLIVPVTILARFLLNKFGPSED